MHPKRRQKLLVIIFVLTACAAAVALLTTALRQNINLFYTPSQVVDGEAPVGKSIRIGGMVALGSFQQLDGVRSQFRVTDFNETISVSFKGLLPDLFREGQGIVARGQLSASGSFEAEEVLAKHDEKYMPPELEGIIPEVN